MPRRTKEEAAETREQIIMAALNVFSKKGYSKGTFVDIANEIGMSKGAVYWHFKTKPDLLAALISYGEEKQCQQIMNKQPASMEEFGEMLREMTHNSIMDEDGRKFEFFLGFQIEWSEQLLTHVQEKLHDMRGDPIADYVRTLSHLKKIGELDADADIDTMALVTACTWVGGMRLALAGDIPLEQFPLIVERCFDAFVTKAKYKN